MIVNALTNSNMVILDLRIWREKILDLRNITVHNIIHFNFFCIIHRIRAMFMTWCFKKIHSSIHGVSRTCIPEAALGMVFSIIYKILAFQLLASPIHF